MRKQQFFFFKVTETLNFIYVNMVQVGTKKVIDKVVLFNIEHFLSLCFFISFLNESSGVP